MNGTGFMSLLLARHDDDAPEERGIHNPQLLDERAAIHHGHLDVGDDDVERLICFVPGERLRTIRGQRDVEPWRHRAVERAADGVVVIDQENAGTYLALGVGVHVFDG